MFKFKSLKDRYKELILSRVLIDKEELTDEESSIINFSYELFQEKLDDIKLLNNEIVRLSIELANLKSYNDNNDYDYEDK